MFLFLTIALVFCSFISLLLIFFFWRERCKTTLNMKLIRRIKELEQGPLEKKLQLPILLPPRDQVSIQQERPSLITICTNCQNPINNEEEEDVSHFIDAVDCGGGGDGHPHPTNNLNTNDNKSQCQEESQKRTKHMVEIMTVIADVVNENGEDVVERKETSASGHDQVDNNEVIVPVKPPEKKTWKETLNPSYWSLPKWK